MILSYRAFVERSPTMLLPHQQTYIQVGNYSVANEGLEFQRIIDSRNKIKNNAAIKDELRMRYTNKLARSSGLISSTVTC